MSPELSQQFLIGKLKLDHLKKEDESEKIPTESRILSRMISFLGKNENFPDHDINILLDLTRGMLANKEIDCITNLSASKLLSFVVETSNEGVKAALILPSEFKEQARTNIIGQLSSLVSAASRIKDYSTGIYFRDLAIENFAAVKLRADASEAQFLNTLSGVLSYQGFDLPVSAHQKQLMREFPEGLVNLPDDIYYPTPLYLPSHVAMMHFRTHN